jgi:hypothetical protein
MQKNFSRLVDSYLYKLERGYICAEINSSSVSGWKYIEKFFIMEKMYEFHINKTTSHRA